MLFAVAVSIIGKMVGNRKQSSWTENRVERFSGALG